MKILLVFVIIFFILWCLWCLRHRLTVWRIGGYYVKCRPACHVRHESEIMDILATGYICVCGRKICHLPQRIQIPFVGSILLITRPVGNSLAYYSDTQKEAIGRTNDAQEQLACIAHNLTKARIAHNDILGRNICIDRNGRIYLIDFEKATYGKEQSYEKVLQQLQAAFQQ